MKPWAVGTVTICGIFSVAVIVLLVWNLKSISTSRDVPSFATVEAIERDYASQTRRLLELAQSAELLFGRNGIGNPTNAELFSNTEILEAELQTSPHSYLCVVPSRHEYRSRVSVLPRLPVEDGAVVNRYWDTLKDGSKMTVLEYHRRTRDTYGDEIGVFLLFDLAALEQKSRCVSPSQDGE